MPNPLSTVINQIAAASYTAYGNAPSGSYLVGWSNGNWVLTGTGLDARTKMPFVTTYSQASAEAVDRITHMPERGQPDNLSALVVDKRANLPVTANSTSSGVLVSLPTGTSYGTLLLYEAALLAAAVDPEPADQYWRLGSEPWSI